MTPSSTLPCPLYLQPVLRLYHSFIVSCLTQPCCVTSYTFGYCSARLVCGLLAFLTCSSVKIPCRLPTYLDFFDSSGLDLSDSHILPTLTIVFSRRIFLLFLFSVPTILLHLRMSIAPKDR